MMLAAGDWKQHMGIPGIPQYLAISTVKMIGQVQTCSDKPTFLGTENMVWIFLVCS